MAQVLPFRIPTRQEQPTPSHIERVSLGNKMQLLARFQPQSLKIVELFVDRLLVAHGGQAFAEQTSIIGRHVARDNPSR